MKFEKQTITPTVVIRRWDSGDIIYTGTSITDAVNSGINLSEANLREADLFGANLFGANLRGANLRGADLFGADLSGADLRGADLFGADLRQADLRGADLRGADLRQANLRNTGIALVQAASYVATITPDSAYIGCAIKSHDWWLSATDQHLSKLDSDAPALMRVYRPALAALMSICKAQGWSEPAKDRGES
jgi:hypothetical protein